MEGEGRSRASERRLYALLAAAALVVIYLVAFIVSNARSVKVSFVVASGHVSLIWVMLGALLVGVILGVAAVELRRRAGGRQSKDASRAMPSSMSPGRHAE